MLKGLIRWICRKYASRIVAQGDLQTAARLWSMAIACGDTSAQTQRALGEVYFRLGDYVQAVALLESAATHFAADNSLAAMLEQARLQAATADSAEEHFRLGNTLDDLKRHDDAVASYRKALAINPDFAEAHSNLGGTLNELGRYVEAAVSCEKALALRPDFAEAHNNLASALIGLKHFARAAASCEMALVLRPDFAEAHFNLGNALSELKRHDEAIACYRRAITLRPDFAEAYNSLGSALIELNRHFEAIKSCEKALALKSDFAEAHGNLGLALAALDRHEEAIASCQKALAIKPDLAAAHINLGNAFNDIKRFEEAIASYLQALELEPDLPEVRISLVHARQHLCEWPQVTPEIAALRAQVTQGRSGKISPFGFLALPETEAREQYLCARQFAEEQYRAFLSRPPLCAGAVRAAGGKIRIGYLSADFHEHATSYLLAEVIERHDHNDFEVFGYSCGPDDASPMRRRMQAAFDTFREINRLSHEAAARQILDDRIDILVDLKGYTENNRLAISALRPAPVQVSWLGYPGTLGHPRLADYLIGDSIVSPLEHADYYSETLALMPHCYQPNDRQRIIGARPSRMAAGLPADGFVFCSLNQCYKITPAMFDLWCRLLTEVPDSVLWLLQSTSAAEHNLRREAQARGVAAERIVFAPRRPLAEHLGRLQLADLALDTYPVTSHTTASDALWAGVPLVARQGETFVSRVAASIVHAAGLPELITTNSEEYYRLALELATRPDQLAKIKAHLAANRLSCPLFDGDRFVRDLERLFRRIWEDYRAGARQHIVMGAAEEDRPRVSSRPVINSASAPALEQTLKEAMAFHRAGDLGGAIRLYLEAIALDPDEPKIYVNLGKALMASGKLEAAKTHFESALRLAPGDPQILCCAGEAAGALGEVDQAAEHFQQAIKQSPDFLPAYLDMGILLENAKRYLEAVRWLQEAVRLDAASASAWHRLGSVFLHMGKVDRGIVHLQKALALDPQKPDTLTSLGAAHAHNAEYSIAEDYFDRALAIAPDFTDARFNRSLIYLSREDYRKGFSEYESRLRKPETQYLAAKSRWPIWKGEPLAGKRLVLLSEQGYGDTIQFIRFAKRLADQGAVVSAEVSAPLRRLIATADGITKVVTLDENLIEADYCCPLMSLPHRMAITTANLAAKLPYVHVSENDRAAWEARLGNRQGLRVGIVWESDAENWIAKLKNISLQELRPVLAMDGLVVISLQVGSGRKQLADLPATIGVTDLASELQDFYDTACLVANLDLVITIDTAVAHLAGALGKPVWVLLHHAPDWRWPLAGNASRWYPSARLFRQSSPGVWAGAVSELKQAMQQVMRESVRQ